MKKRDYREIVSHLPKPPREQIRRFAEYVSSAHSWYKHLPLDPPVPFVFFLDPNAGRQMVHNLLWQTRYVNLPEGQEYFHYSTRPTSVYRERFGYWNYYAPYGSFFVLPSLWSLLDTRSSRGPRIVYPGSGTILIPDQLVTAGTANLTSLVHPGWEPMMCWRTHPDGSMARAGFFDFFDSERAGLPEELRLAIQSYLTKSERKCALSRAEGAESSPNEDRSDELRKLMAHPALVKARELQLQGMEQAMQRFVELVFGPDL